MFWLPQKFRPSNHCIGFFLFMPCTQKTPNSRSQHLVNNPGNNEWESFGIVSYLRSLQCQWGNFPTSGPDVKYGKRATFGLFLDFRKNGTISLRYLGLTLSGDACGPRIRFKLSDLWNVLAIEQYKYTHFHLPSKYCRASCFTGIDRWLNF